MGSGPDDCIETYPDPERDAPDGPGRCNNCGALFTEYQRECSHVDCLHDRIAWLEAQLKLANVQTARANAIIDEATASLKAALAKVTP